MAAAVSQRDSNCDPLRAFLLLPLTSEPPSHPASSQFIHSHTTNARNPSPLFTTIASGHTDPLIGLSPNHSIVRTQLARHLPTHRGNTTLEMTPAAAGVVFFAPLLELRFVVAILSRSRFSTSTCKRIDADFLCFSGRQCQNLALLLTSDRRIKAQLRQRYLLRQGLIQGRRDDLRGQCREV